ncbi:unnamed protein product [Lupinus luteus]|uniref:Uncharacterized protein n=1 Tax=Lupinus luteus TaxID=3873 RepID=A0AAV1Y2B4_LUPLU
MAAATAAFRLKHKETTTLTLSHFRYFLFNNYNHAARIFNSHSTLTPSKFDQPFTNNNTLYHFTSFKPFSFHGHFLHRPKTHFRQQQQQPRMPSNKYNNVVASSSSSSYGGGDPPEVWSGGGVVVRMEKSNFDGSGGGGDSGNLKEKRLGGEEEEGWRL